MEKWGGALADQLPPPVSGAIVLQRLLQVRNEVVRVLETDVKPHQGTIVNRPFCRARRVGGHGKAFESAPAVTDSELFQRVDQRVTRRFVTAF